MVKIKSASEIDKKYKDAISRVPANYKAGVMATTNWQEKAASSEAEDLWKAKIAEAAAASRRQKAVAQVSNSEWQGKAANVGATRIGAGMTAGADKRTRNFEPYRSAIEGTSLPPRSADPLANVDNRVKPIVSNLVATKKSIKG